MARGAGSGDKLARGAVKATYSVTEKTITQKKWDDMFEGFDPEAFLKKKWSKGDGTKEVIYPR